MRSGTDTASTFFREPRAEWNPPFGGARAEHRLRGVEDCPLPTMERLHPCWRSATFVCLLAVVTLGGCRATDKSASPNVARVSKTQAADRRLASPIRRVFCLFDQKRWMNLDAAGDRDPEGVHYRVYLVAETGKGVWRDGEFHVEMYRIDREGSGGIVRTLISDWDYPTSAFPRVDSPILGRGYHVRLRWARKDTAGNEIELITHYRDPDGRAVRSSTQRLRVPKYTS